jgi:hypothetical protein
MWAATGPLAAVGLVSQETYFTAECDDFLVQRSQCLLDSLRDHGLQGSRGRGRGLGTVFRPSDLFVMVRVTLGLALVGPGEITTH